MATSQLSQENVIRDVHDVDNHSLRTTTEAVILGDVQVDVTLTSDDDSVSIGSPDGQRQAEVNGNSELLVHDTEANTHLTAIQASTASIDSKVSTSALQTAGNATLTAIEADTTSIDSKLPSGLSVSGGRLLVDSTGTSSVTGSVTVNNGIGAAAVNIQDGGNSITVDGTVAATQSGPWDINNITGTVSLPTGASTAALQTAGNASLSSIDSKVPAGLTVKAANTPAVATDQALVVAISPNNPIILSGSVEISNDVGNPIPVNGTVAATQSGVWTTTVTQATGANLHTVVDSGSITVDNAAGASAVNIQDGGNSITVDGTVAATQSGAWTTTVTQATGLNLHTVVDSGTITVTQATGTNLHTVVDASALPTGASTSALQTTGNASLASIDGKIPAGLTVKAASAPAVATDQALVVAISPNNPITLSGSVEVSNDVGNPLPVSGTVAATQSGTWNINNITGTVSLPTGASTSALQTTGNNSLASIDTKITDGSQRTRITDGTNNAALSNAAPTGTEQGLIVRNIPSGTQAISAASLPLPTGAATEATLATRVADTTITARLNTLGQKTSANSAPVVLASDQSAIPVTGPLTDAQLRATAVPVSLADSTTRELGRVLASDILFASEVFNTTSNVFANARPTNGNLDVRRYKTKTILVRNTSANTGRYTVLASVDGGTTYDVTVVPDTAVAANVSAVINTDAAYTNIQIQVRSAVNGQSTTYTTKAYAMGT